MKKFICILITLSIILLVSISTYAAEQKTVLRIDSVYYDSTSNTYCINCIDENGESWIIELFAANKQSKSMLSNLNRTFKSKWIIATFEDYDNNYLYDDDIINWYIEE